MNLATTRQTMRWTHIPELLIWTQTMCTSKRASRCSRILRRMDYQTQLVRQYHKTSTRKHISPAPSAFHQHHNLTDIMIGLLGQRHHRLPLVTIGAATVWPRCNQAHSRCSISP